VVSRNKTFYKTLLSHGIFKTHTTSFDIHKQKTMKNILIFIFLISFSSIYCQTSNDNNNKLWGALGIGAYHVSSSEGFAFNIGVDNLKNKNLWKLRLICDFEFNLFGPEPQEQYYDIGLLCGKFTNTEIIRLSISGGLGVLGGVKRGAFLYSKPGLFAADVFEKKFVFSPSIPVEIEFNVFPTENFGIGITGFANLNFENALVGFIIKLEFGRIR
jgi:hypothetical protein